MGRMERIFMTNPVTIDDLFSLEFIGQLKSCGQSLFFVRAVCDEENNTYKKNIECAKNGTVFALTGEEKSSNFVCENENTVWFTGPGKDPEKEETILYAIDANGGEREEKAVLAKKDLSLVGAVEDHLLVLSEDVSLIKEEPDYEVLDEDPWYINAQGFVNKKRTRFYTWNKNTDVLQECPIPDDLIIGSMKIAGDRLVFTASLATPKPDLTDGIYVWNFCSSTLETLVEPGVYAIQGMEAAENGVYFFANAKMSENINAYTPLYYCGYQDHAVTKVSEKTFTVGNTVGTDCQVVGGNATLMHEGRFYFVTTITNHNILLCWNGTEYDEVLNWAGSINSFAFAGEDLWFIGCAPDQTNQLWKVENVFGNTMEPICHSDFNAFLHDRYVASARPVVFAGWKGEPQTGWVLYPKDFDENKSYPGILDIHGGPKTVYGTVFYHEMQVWASQGYFVFFCNPYGSDGQGQEYSDMRGQYGRQDYEDLMNFTDEVLKVTPQLDPNRLCVTGGSYGGFMTNWIIGHTNRFVAAASQRSISNWISMFGTSDIGPYFVRDQIGCGLENPEQLWDRSPLKYAHNAKTPTLFIHSDEDYRCPLEQGLQILHTLMDQGTETRMCLFHKENHELSRSGRPLHRKRRLNEITDWMNKHARK